MDTFTSFLSKITFTDKDDDALPFLRLHQGKFRKNFTTLCFVDFHYQDSISAVYSACPMQASKGHAHMRYNQKALSFFSYMTNTHKKDKIFYTSKDSVLESEEYSESGRINFRSTTAPKIMAVTIRGNTHTNDMPEKNKN
jgi:hypothetical protein